MTSSELKVTVGQQCTETNTDHDDDQMLDDTMTRFFGEDEGMKAERGDTSVGNPLDIIFLEEEDVDQSFITHRKVTETDNERFDLITNQTTRGLPVATQSNVYYESSPAEGGNLRHDVTNSSLNRTTIRDMATSGIQRRMDSVASNDFANIQQVEHPSHGSGYMSGLADLPETRIWQPMLDKLYKDKDDLQEANTKQADMIKNLLIDNTEMKRIIEEQRRGTDQLQQSNRLLEVEKNNHQLAKVKIDSLEQQLDTMHEQQRLAIERIEELEKRISLLQKPNVLPQALRCPDAEGSGHQESEGSVVYQLQSD